LPHSKGNPTKKKDGGPSRASRRPLEKGGSQEGGNVLSTKDGGKTEMILLYRRTAAIHTSSEKKLGKAKEGKK